MDRRSLLKLSAGAAALQMIPGLVLAQQGGTFKIGSLTPVTGAGSPYGPGMQQMIRAAADEVNAAGGAGDNMTSGPVGRKFFVFKIKGKFAVLQQ